VRCDIEGVPDEEMRLRWVRAIEIGAVGYAVEIERCVVRCSPRNGVTVAFSLGHGGSLLIPFAAPPGDFTRLAEVVRCALAEALLPVPVAATAPAADRRPEGSGEVLERPSQPAPAIE
jgi:hypothetical protein